MARETDDGVTRRDEWEERTERWITAAEADLSQSHCTVISNYQDNLIIN